MHWKRLLLLRSPSQSLLVCVCSLVQVNCAGDICENYFENFSEPLLSPSSGEAEKEGVAFHSNLSPPAASGTHSASASSSASPLHHAASVQTRPIKYLRLFLLDTQDEDLMAVVYPVMEFIEAARAEGRIQLSAVARHGLELAAKAAEAKAAANAALAVLHNGTDSASASASQFRQEPQSAAVTAATAGSSAPTATADRAAIPTSICPRVLIHCQQGVSRSTALCIAYLMLDGSREYEDAYAQVRAIRGITRPNFGFIAQLKAWRVRMQGWEAAAAAQERNAIESRTAGSDTQRAAALVRTLPPSMHLYRAAPHCSRDRRIVLKLADSPSAASVDSRSIFILSTQPVLYIWVGALVLPQQEAAYMVQIWKQVARLRRYEHAAAFHVVLRQKDEMRWNAEEMDRRRREFQNSSALGTPEIQIGVRELYEIRAAPVTAAPTPTNSSSSGLSFSPSPDVPPAALERSPSQTLFLRTLMSPNAFQSLVSSQPSPPPLPPPRTQTASANGSPAAQSRSITSSPSPLHRSLSGTPSAAAAAQSRSISPAPSQQQHLKSQSGQLLSPVKDGSAAGILSSPSKPPMHPQSASLAASPNAGFLRGDSSGGGSAGGNVPAGGTTMSPARGRAISPGSSPNCSPHRPPRQLSLSSSSTSPSSASFSPAPGQTLSSSPAAVAATTPAVAAATRSPSPLPPLPSPPVAGPVDPSTLSWQDHSRNFWGLLNGSPATELLVSEFEEDYPAHEWMALHLMTQAAAAAGAAGTANGHAPMHAPVNERRRSKTEHGSAGHHHAGSSGTHLGTPLLRSRTATPQPPAPACLCHIIPCVCGHRLADSLSLANLDALPAPHAIGRLDSSRRNSRDSRRNSITASQQRRRSSAASTSHAAAAAAAALAHQQATAAAAAAVTAGPAASSAAPPPESVSRCTSRAGTDGMSFTLTLPTSQPLPAEVETLAVFPPLPLPVTPSRPRHRHARSQSYDGDDEDTDVDLMRGASDASNPASTSAATTAEQAPAADTLSVSTASPPLHPRGFIVVGGSIDEKPSRPHSRLQRLDTDEEVSTTEDDGSPVSADAAAAAASRAASLLYAAGSARGTTGTGAGGTGGSRFVSPRLNPLFIGLGEPVPPGFVANSGLELRADSSDSDEEEIHEANAAGLQRGYSRNASGIKGVSPLPPGGRRHSGSTRGTPVKSAGHDAGTAHVHSRRPSDSTRHATVHHAATLPAPLHQHHAHTTTHHHAVSAAASLASPPHGIFASVSFTSPVQPATAPPLRVPPLIPVLWSYPAVEELTSFDLDDLHSDEVFVLQWADPSASRKHRRGADDSDDSTSDSDEEVAEVRNLRLRAMSAAAVSASPLRAPSLFSPSDSNGAHQHSQHPHQSFDGSHPSAPPPPPPFDHLSVRVSSTSASPPAVRSLDGGGLSSGTNGNGASSTLSQSSTSSSQGTPQIPMALQQHASTLPPLHVVSPPTAFSPESAASAASPAQHPPPPPPQPDLRPIHVWFGSNARTGASRLSEGEMSARAREIVVDFLAKRRRSEEEERAAAEASASESTGQPSAPVSDLPPLDPSALLAGLDVRVEREGSESALFLDGFQDG